LPQACFGRPPKNVRKTTINQPKKKMWYIPVINWPNPHFRVNPHFVGQSPNGSPCF
jgi:hypothetical protein